MDRVDCKKPTLFLVKGKMPDIVAALYKSTTSLWDTLYIIYIQQKEAPPYIAIMISAFRYILQNSRVGIGFKEILRIWVLNWDIF